MRWAVNLYTTEKTKRNLKHIQKSMKRKWIKPNVYLIALASNENNLLDIIHSSMYLQKVFQNMNPDIVGVAEDYGAALDLVLEMIQDQWKRDQKISMKDQFVFQE